jgi:hypothetical protein
VEDRETIPRRLKPLVLKRITGTDKSVPFQNHEFLQISQEPVNPCLSKQRGIANSSASCKAVPFQNNEVLRLFQQAANPCPFKTTKYCDYFSKL